jgi:hypothetical protein
MKPFEGWEIRSETSPTRRTSAQGVQEFYDDEAQMWYPVGDGQVLPEGYRAIQSPLTRTYLLNPTTGRTAEAGANGYFTDPNGLANGRYSLATRDAQGGFVNMGGMGLYPQVVDAMDGGWYALGGPNAEGNQLGMVNYLPALQATQHDYLINRKSDIFDKLTEMGPLLLGSAGLGALAGPALASATGLSQGVSSSILKGLLGAATGGNPLKSLAGTALTAGLNSLGGFGGFDASPLDTSNVGTGATISVNPLEELRGGNMDDFDLGSLFADPTDQQLQQLWAQNLGALGDNGQIDWSNIDAQLNDPNNPLFMGSTDGASFDPGGSLGGLSGLSSGLAKLLGLPAGSGGTSGVGGTGSGGGGSGGGFPIGAGLDLAARLAPGLGALAFAQSQGSVDTSPISNLLGNGASTFNSPFDTTRLNNLYEHAPPDTSRLSSLYSQVGDITGRNTASALTNFDLKTGQARGDLRNGLERRGVLGSSFGNMDIGNFDTMAGNQRGMLEGQLGLQGVAAQAGLANNMLGAEQAYRQQQGGLANSLLGAEQGQRQQQLGYLGQQGTVASQLLNAQLQQKAIQSALYGRAFDTLGKAVAPTPVQYGGNATTQTPSVSSLLRSIFG